MGSEASETDSLKIDLWTSRSMDFVVKGRIITIPPYTECHKPPYTRLMKRKMVAMEHRGFYRPSSEVKAVCVVLKGQQRYVWRTDVLTRSQYDKIRKSEKESIVRMFSKKS